MVDLDLDRLAACPLGANATADPVHKRWAPLLATERLEAVPGSDAAQGCQRRLERDLVVNLLGKGASVLGGRWSFGGGQSKLRRYLFLLLPCFLDGLFRRLLFRRG